MDSDTVKRVACIGSGNVASSLLPALYGAGYKITQICSRNRQTAQQLAKMVGAASTFTLTNLDPNADFYIIAAPDDEVENVLNATSFGDGMVVHMSGSTPLSIFEGKGIAHYGVLYPLQTFTQQRSVNFARVPLYVEAGSEKDLAELMFMARKLSVDVFKITSEKRMLLHISAVFACNFSNHLMAIASRLLHDENLDFNALKPLIRETFERAIQLDEPSLVQTGPAARGDSKIISRHVKALTSYPLIQQIYSLMSESISSNASNQKQTTKIEKLQDQAT
ncbi:MAG: DUF2520 domain-containing protein [Prevotellaceae bacterium]|jgi:predicted short-subunit dehydrogenase-like oxidoreductase (DUF2520 family)|nr:DUF2520 domain-containing protein [Prevotellaceae bacterium]